MELTRRQALLALAAGASTGWLGRVSSAHAAPAPIPMARQALRLRVGPGTRLRDYAALRSRPDSGGRMANFGRLGAAVRFAENDVIGETRRTAFPPGREYPAQYRCQDATVAAWRAAPQIDRFSFGRGDLRCRPPRAAPFAIAPRPRERLAPSLD